MATTLNKLCIISLFLCVTCKATSQATGILQPSGELFAGSPTLCRIPRRSTYCDVNYPVPDIIATLTNILELEVKLIVERDTMPGQELDLCQQTMKEVFCAQKFPRCVDNNVILTSTDNCEQKFHDNCPIEHFVAEDAAVYCALEDASISLGTCSALSTFTSFSGPLEYCNILDGNMRVTEWMFRFIRSTDKWLSLAVSNTSFLGILSPHCSYNYAKYFCQYMGECTHDSSEIQLKNDYHFCETTLNCYDNFIADALSFLFPCNEWSNLDYLERPSDTAPEDSVTNMRNNAGGDVMSIVPSPRTYPYYFSGSQTVQFQWMVCVTALLFSVV